MYFSESHDFKKQQVSLILVALHQGCPKFGLGGPFVGLDLNARIVCRGTVDKCLDVIFTDKILDFSGKNNNLNIVLL